jgi:hypothetical protein
MPATIVARSETTFTVQIEIPYVRADSASFRFFRQIIAEPVSSRAARSSLSQCRPGPPDHRSGP